MTQTLRQYLSELLEEVPGDTVESQIVWLMEQLRDTRKTLHDTQNLLALHKDLGEKWAWIDEVMRELRMAEVTRKGGEEYKGLTLIDQQSDADCLQACIATLTGIDYADVVSVEGMNPDDWRNAIDVWAHAKRGRFTRHHEMINWPLNRVSAAFIGLGLSPRGGGKNHAVIVDRWGDLVFDPHYSRRGLQGPVLEAWQWSVDLSSRTGR